MKIVMFNSDHFATPQEAKTAGALYPVATPIELDRIDELMAVVEATVTCIGLLKEEIKVCIDTDHGYIELNESPLDQLTEEFGE